jgi:hypothetical protein
LTDLELENRLKNLKSEAMHKTTCEDYNSSTSGTSTPSTPSVDRYFKYKGKEIDGSNLSEQEINRRIMEQATGNSMEKFQRESTDLLAKINHFTELHETDGFPNLEIKEGMYSALKAKLLSITMLTPKLYSDWLNQKNVASSISKFFNLKDNLDNKVTDDNLETKSVAQQSDTYQEVALATVEEQEVWSDKTNTDVQSPYLQQEQFPADSQEQHKETTSLLGEFIQEVWSDDVVQTETVEQPKSGFNALLEQIKARRDDSNVIGSPNVQQPEIKVDSASSSMDHYFPKSENVISQDAAKSSFTNLFKDIKSQRKEYGTPVIENSTLENTVEQVVKTENKSVFKSLLEQINDRRNDTDVIENVASSSKVEVPKSPLSNILDTVKGLFTPKSEPKSIPKQPSNSNLYEDTAALFDDELVPDNNQAPQQEVQTQVKTEEVDINSNIINSWDKVNIDINDGSVKIEFGDMWRYCTKVHFATNNNHLLTYDFDPILLNSTQMDKSHITETFNLKENLNFNNLGIKTEIREILMTDLEGRYISVYKNDKFFT